MEIRPGEYLNLTFLNSVYLVYAIQNHKIGGWRRGGMTVDYANSIPYLNKALEYIRKREKEEAVMLGRYMELYEGWQVDVSEWRLKNNYHRLTDARAGKFAKEKAGKIPAFPCLFLASGGKTCYTIRIKNGMEDPSRGGGRVPPRPRA